MKRLLLIFLMSCAVFGVQAQVQLMEDASGLRYKIIDDQPGKKAEIGNLVSLHMVAKSSTGATIKNSYVEKGGKEILFPVKVSGFDADLYKAVSLLSEGDSAIFAINADSLYERTFRRPRPSNVLAGSDVMFTIKVFKIYRSQKAYRDSLVARQSQTFDQKRAEEEDAMIKNYLIQNDLDAKISPSGLYYIDVDSDSTKPTPKVGQTVVLEYSCTLLDGTPVESTYEMGKLFSFIMGQNALVPGWEEGVAYTPLGGSATLLIPSRLAYKHLSKGAIKPHSVIRMDIKVVSIR